MSRHILRRGVLRCGQLLAGPSLTRRLVVSVLVAFTLVALVLVATSYLSFHRNVQDHTPLLTACRHLGEALQHAGTVEESRAVVRAAETYFNASREDFSQDKGRHLEPLLFEFNGRAGERLYASGPLQQTRLQGRVGQATAQHFNGRVYWTCEASFPMGSVRLAESLPADTTVLSWIGVDLLPDLLIAFPFVVGPVWLAMRQGLRPLRQLARQLDARAPDDFSPIRQPLRHAELRPLITAFDALLARLRDAVQRERAFVQDAAHELRTPMAVIAAQAHVLSQAQTGEARQQAAAAMEGALARASHLSAQLLAMAALDDQRALVLQPVDLAALVQQALADADAVARDRGLTLSLDAPDHWVVSLDKAAFQSVLQNLLDNALRYVPAGGTVEVTLRAQGDAGWCLRVADDGPGIAADERERLFERFVRGRESHRASGTGLGLAIARQAMARLGGELRLAPGLQGRGVAFEATAPASAASPDASSVGAASAAMR